MKHSHVRSINLTQSLHKLRWLKKTKKHRHTLIGTHITSKIGRKHQFGSKLVSGEKKSVLTNASTFKKFVDFLSNLNPLLFFLGAETDAKTSVSLKTLIRSHNQKTSLLSFQLPEFLNFRQNLQNWTVPKYIQCPIRKNHVVKKRKTTKTLHSRKLRCRWIVVVLLVSIRKIYVIVLLSPLLSLRIYKPP